MASSGCIPFILFLVMFLNVVEDIHGIQGGVLSPIADFPYQAFLMTNHVYSCSATILNEQWVVTAAQCASGLTVGLSIVGVGVNRFLTNSNLRQEHEHSIEEVIIHPDFDEFSKENDIALIKLENHINFTTGPMKPIERIAAANEQFAPGTRGLVAGWGHIAALWSTNVTIVTHDECSSALSRYGSLANSMICAHGYNGDACHGDAGAGLTVEGKLIGITSWGLGCFNSLYPSVYASIAEPGIRNFITTHTNL